MPTSRGKRFMRMGVVTATWGLLNSFCLCASRFAPLASGHRHMLAEARGNTPRPSCEGLGIATPFSILWPCPGSSRANSRTDIAQWLFAPMEPVRRSHTHEGACYDVAPLWAQWCSEPCILAAVFGAGRWRRKGWGLVPLRSPRFGGPVGGSSPAMSKKRRIALDGGQTEEQALVSTPLARAPPPGNTVQSPPPCASAVEAPHRGRICLDQVGVSQWWLTDLVTQQSVLLPEHADWEIVIDESSGFGMLARGGDGEDIYTADLDSFLTERVFCELGPDEKLYIESAGKLAKLTDVLTLQTRFAEAVASIKIGAACTRADATVYIFKRKRTAGALVFWNLHSVYDKLALSSYNKVPSKWVGKSLPRWAAWLQQWPNLWSIVKSTSCNHSATEDLPDASMCLPTSAASTVTLLLLLWRWSCCSRASGGLEDVGDRRAAKELLLALLRCLAPVAIVCNVLVQQDWSCRWPRPHQVMGFTMVELPINKLEIDLNPLASLEGSGGACAKKWLRSILGKEYIGNDLKLSAASFLQAAAGCRILAPLVGQIMWGLASAIDRELFKACTGRTEPARREVGLHKATDWKRDDRAMHAHLCKYMAAAQLETATQQFYCIATDKGTPGGYSLQNTLLSFPCGLGVIAPPAVLANWGGGSLRRDGIGCRRHLRHLRIGFALWRQN